MPRYTVFGFYTETGLQYSDCLAADDPEQLIQRVTDRIPDQSISIVAIIEGEHSNLLGGDYIDDTDNYRDEYNTPDHHDIESEDMSEANEDCITVESYDSSDEAIPVLRQWMMSLNEHDRDIVHTALLSFIKGFSEFPKHVGRQNEVMTETQLANEHVGWDAAREAMFFFAALCMAMPEKDDQ